MSSKFDGRRLLYGQLCYRRHHHHYYYNYYQSRNHHRHHYEQLIRAHKHQHWKWHSICQPEEWSSLLSSIQHAIHHSHGVGALVSHFFPTLNKVQNRRWCEGRVERIFFLLYLNKPLLQKRHRQSGVLMEPLSTPTVTDSSTASATTATNANANANTNAITNTVQYSTVIGNEANFELNECSVLTDCLT